MTRFAGTPLLLALLLPCAAVPGALSAQAAPAHVLVTVSGEGRPLQAAEVRSAGRIALTDTTGRALLTLPPGRQRIVTWEVGYSVDTLFLALRPAQDTSVSVHLRAVAQELAPIVVRAARVETRIEEEPERVEVLAPEDVQEKTLTSPGNMTNLLVEMGGVHVQPVAPGLGGAAIRVQGVPGRYTLLLTDGLPLSGGHAPAFSLVQAPPLDLRQVEVIKGAASALYGASALGGVVDLVSKTPDDSRDVVLSQSTRGGTDGLLWLSRRISPRWGYTALAGLHRQDREDVGGDGWADIPGYRRAEARPRLFWSGRNGSTALVTAGGTWERRRGGTVAGATVASGTAFPEALDTRHLDAGTVAKLVLGHRTRLGLRAAAATTRHDRTFGDWSERNRISALFGEATLSLTASRHQAVIGAAGQRDAFRTSPRTAFDFAYGTLSLFAADTYTPVAPLSLAAAVRADRHSRYGTFLSPRVSALYRLGGDWSVRASLARGFQAPSPAIGETEDVGFRHLAGAGPLVAETGESVSLDVGGSVGPVQLSGTAFGVRIRHPVLPLPVPGDSIDFSLVNAIGPIRSAGVELFGVYAREPFLVTATYSHTRATELSPQEDARIALPLTPRNAGGIDVAWEEDEPGESGFRAAVEAFYTGRQRVEEDPYRTFTPGYLTVDVLVSKRFGAVTLFANGENLTGVRQTRWDPLLRSSPGLGGRWTTEEWAPLEGRAVNVGVRARF